MRKHSRLHPALICSIAALATTQSASARGASLGSITEIEPTNNTVAGATELAFNGNCVMRSVFELTPGDSDFIKVLVPLFSDSDAYLIIVTPLGTLPGGFTGPDTIIDLYSETGDPITTNDDSGSDYPIAVPRGSIARYVNISSDDFLIRIRGFNAVSAGRYQLIVAKVNIDDECSPDWVNSLETPLLDPDDLALADEPAMLGFGQVNGVGDVDYVDLHMNEGDVLTLSVVGVDGLNNNFTSPDIDLAILSTDASTTLVSSAADGAAQFPGGTASSVGGTIRFRAPSTGRYFARFTGVTTGGFGFYAVVSSYIPAPAACTGDADGNGAVEFLDIASVLANFGAMCP